MKRSFTRAPALAALIAATTAAGAAAYVVPGLAAGTPGGPPTSATGGNAGSQIDATTAATSLAGYTSDELSQISGSTTRVPGSSTGPSTVTINVYGTINGTTMGRRASAASVAAPLLATGKTTVKKNGKSKLTIHFSGAGKAYLLSHPATPLTVKATVRTKIVVMRGHKKHARFHTYTSKAHLVTAN